MYLSREEDITLDQNNLAKMNSVGDRVLLLDQKGITHSYYLPENSPDGWKSLAAILVGKPWVTTDHMATVMGLSIDELRM